MASGRVRRWTAAALIIGLSGVAVSAAAALMWRASVRQHARQTQRVAAENVTATLATLLSSDADFVATLRTVLELNPQIGASGFNRWYDDLKSEQRQVGGIGTAVVRIVPARDLATFEAQRDADPAFRALAGGRLRPVVPRHTSRYCLVTAGGAIGPIRPIIAALAQEDWCNRASPVGAAQAPWFRATSDTGQVAVVPVDGRWLHTVLLESAVYRPGAPLRTVAQRRAAVEEWLLSSFDMTSLIRAAIGHNRNLRLALYHANFGRPWQLVAEAGEGRGASARQPRRLAVDGQWAIDVRQAPPSDLSPDLQGGLLFAGGSLVSVLLSLLLLTLTRSRERAMALVAEKTSQLRHQALHDALTGLPNRVLALDRAEQMLARARRSDAPIAALYLDIDGFKHINDTFGHLTGDQLLQTVARRLLSAIRESDTAARLSGDEFVVLLEGSVLDAGPELVAERLLNVLREPYDLGADGGRRLRVTASIGVAYGKRSTAEALLADADLALYEAKASGRDTYAVFESAMQTAAQDRLTLEMDLAGALEAGELFLVYQPTFELQSERPIGIEALLRWRHPTRGLIGPDVFIPLAEQSGQIVSIGRWVLEQACRQTAEWRAAGHLLDISVNVSGRQLSRDEFIGQVAHALEVSGLDPCALMLEITETTLIHDTDAIAHRLGALKDLGVRVAIDDFGTGYSSLAYLRQFSIDALKIDRSFIQGLDDSGESAALIRTLVQLGKTLGIKTLAEGIEEVSQLEQLQREHCDHGQGFLLARPLDRGAMEEFLAMQLAPQATAS